MDDEELLTLLTSEHDAVKNSALRAYMLISTSACPRCRTARWRQDGAVRTFVNEGHNRLHHGHGSLNAVPHKIHPLRLSSLQLFSLSLAADFCGYATEQERPISDNTFNCAKLFLDLTIKLFLP